MGGCPATGNWGFLRGQPEAERPGGAVGRSVSIVETPTTRPVRRHGTLEPLICCRLTVEISRSENVSSLDSGIAFLWPGATKEPVLFQSQERYALGVSLCVARARISFRKPLPMFFSATCQVSPRRAFNRASWRIPDRGIAWQWIPWNENALGAPSISSSVLRRSVAAQKNLGEPNKPRTERRRP